MKIGIDARFLNESGVGRYLRNLISNLQVLDKENEYFIFLLPKDLDNFKQAGNFNKSEANFKWYGFAEQFQLPKLLKKHRFDLVHFPHFNVPIFYSGKFVVTIHDLIHQHHQMKRATTLNPFTFKIKQFGYKRVFKNAVTKSCKILVPSNSVRELLINEWRVDSEKIVVTPEAVDERIISLKSKVKSKKVLDKFDIKPPYTFYVGNAHPHKNVEGLITAFLKLRETNPDLKLILAGGDSYFWQRIKKDQQEKGIIYAGFVTDEELVALYKNAECLIIPSFEEGFGLPVLEAMALGCPVVTSNTASLPEVAGKAAIYFDPNKIDDMVNKISQVLKNVNLRKKLIEKGKNRVKLFSWKKMAGQTLEVYTKCGLQ
ncbi:MAG: Glycosyl transferase, group 1 [Microgenomates group bacterium Gr01-1014_7]|nr:MAG: Glycosyl transferase, group 1 [Microgenomates group bacterium Gr01-1014_7]